MFTRFNTKTLGIVLLITMLGLAACAPAATPPAAPPAPAPANPAAATNAPASVAPAAKPVTLQIASNDKLGKILADGNGNTLYLLTKDAKGASKCYDQCAASWPAVIPQGAPTLKEGIDTNLISTTLRTDGSAQLTYNGWPLYHFEKDSAPGDTNGQGVGNVWWVVSGEGNPIKPATVALTPTEKLGNILVDGSGMSLYLFTVEKPGQPNCYGKCEVFWPPLLTIGQPTLGNNVSTAAISTTLRKDGTVQVTYNGWPLYYFSKDQAPGDVKGQGVTNNWWVVSGEGNAIKPAALAVAQNATLGKILVDDKGRTLYAFAKDTKDTSTCYDKCEAAWWPLLQTDKPTLGDGVDASMVGTTQRKDGSTQVTYNGMPLYYFFKDQAAGDTNGQGVANVWYVVAPDGKTVK